MSEFMYFCTVKLLKHNIYETKAITILTNHYCYVGNYRRIL